MNFFKLSSNICEKNDPHHSFLIQIASLHFIKVQIIDFEVKLQIKGKIYFGIIFQTH